MMLKRPRFVAVGGFMGAGKTTLLARLARHYLAQGRKVGLIANDLGPDLVDTRVLRAQGLAADEIAGACVCCRFDELLAASDRLASADSPEILLLEPVGACVDLVATVLEPLERLQRERFDVGPLVVLLKPEHAREILSGTVPGAASKAAYIVLKQLEEADLIVLNQIDRLLPGQRDELLQLIHSRFPDKAVLAASARQGEGIEELAAMLDRGRPAQRTALEIDYDRYAACEAEFAWLNARLQVEHLAGEELPLDYLVLELVTRIDTILRHTGGEPAHLKVLGSSGDEIAVCNLISSCRDVELSIASHARAARFELIVNIRAAADPERLSEALNLAMSQLSRARNVRYEVVTAQSFRPLRPVPTHRIPIVTPQSVSSGRRA